MTPLENLALNLKTLFPFDLDEFQLQAIGALDAGRSVVVCAPTGSGKTLVGEYAIYRALARNRRVFYTTPLKALSNQKLRDFRRQFGQEQVGLLTGDTSINREAPVLVMTTEIFRNMLYGTPIGEVGTSLSGVETVVLDECHYMNDRQRGTVWEESIIYCPPEIQLVALSATVANSDQLTEWISQVHGPTDLVYSDYRPVPLQFHFCTPKGLFPLLNPEGTHPNPRIKAKTPHPGGRRDPKAAPPAAFILHQLWQRDMLPAIYFIFSRRGCDQSVASLGGLSLINPAEAALLRSYIDEFLASNPEAARDGQVESLYRGIAAHHAGILPAWKSLVEELFQQGLIKVVFATETLAAGINMPARTTVISSLSKRTDQGHRLLNPSEFLQMAGRAGRRGMDAQGHVVTVQTAFEGIREAAYLATAEADPLVSQFTPSYGMVLNLLQTHTLEEAQDLIERSFGQYLAGLYLQPQIQSLNQLTRQLEQIQTGAPDFSLVKEYEGLRQQVKQEKQLLRTLQQQNLELQADELAPALLYAIPGTILRLRSDQAAVLVKQVPGSGQFPYLVCLSEDGVWQVTRVTDVVALHGEFPCLRSVTALPWPEQLRLKPGETWPADAQALQVAGQIPPLPALRAAPEVQAQQERLEDLQTRIDRHPLHRHPDRATLIKQRQQVQDLGTKIRDQERQIALKSHHYWDEFLKLIAVLQTFGCLEGQKPTPLGQTAAALRGDNELWLGLTLVSGHLDHLAPHHLAAAAAALVTEVSRPDSWTSYHLSPETETALGDLRGIRRQLFQTQRRHEVVMPIWLEVELVALVEQWALGVDWSTLCAQTSLDEGDVVRILRRSLDFLSQIPHVPHLGSPLVENARRAAYLMDRFPVNEAVS